MQKLVLLLAVLVIAEATYLHNGELISDKDHDYKKRSGGRKGAGKRRAPVEADYSEFIASFQNHLEIDESCAEEESMNCILNNATQEDYGQLQQQAESLEGYEDLSEEEQLEKIQELTNDPQTGAVWSCLLTNIEAECESEFILSAHKLNSQRESVQNFVVDFQKHLEIDEGCAEEEAMNCILNNASEEDYDQLQQQAESLEGFEDLSEEEQLDKIQELTNDPQTGAVWSCMLTNVEAECESEFILSAHKLNSYKGSVQNFVVAFQRHFDEEEFDGECAEEEAINCFMQADPSTYGKLEEQGNHIAGLSDGEAIALIDEYEADGETGETWTCIFNAVSEECMDAEF